MDMIGNGFGLATSPTDTLVELYVLHHKLQICSIQREEISRFTHPLIKISLLEGSKPQFFSFTETNQEYTIVIPEEDLEKFPDDIKTSGRIWRALTVSAGAVGAFLNELGLAGVSKIAKAVISPLAECDISVFCISTYQSDFILVQETDLPDAIECLGKTFKIFDENHTKIGGPKRGAMLHSIFTDSNKCREISKQLLYPELDYFVTGIAPADLPRITQTLLELMFFSTKQGNDELQTFFHFSIIDDDVSFILDEESLSRFPPDTVYHPANRERWRIIHIGDAPLGFEESGIVAKIAEPLATAQISIYYISTFDNDHALVPEEEIENVAALLEKFKNIPCSHHQEESDDNSGEK